MNLINELNQEQRKVVETTEGPVLVLAGAGSGKTRCVIARSVYLIKNKRIKPWNILVVTFTNKAARELKNRLESALGISTRGLWIGTFHSICARILRFEHERLPFDQNFSIFDDDDQKAVFKKIYNKLSINTKEFPVNSIRSVISRQKSSLIRVDDFFDFNESNFFTDMAHKLYGEYQKELLANNAIDFDDLLMYTAYLLDENPDIRLKYQQMFPYVMIDEYQDTNYAQFKIVNFIAKKHNNLCVVGDDDQAIYSWRGADIKNILQFDADYKDATVIKLERNYRSPKQVLMLANEIISKNQSRHGKELWTDLESKEKPRLSVLDNENDEAQFVANRIAYRMSEGSSPDDCVVLYRTNAQSRVLENAFRRAKISYKIVGGVNFYQRKEIKDLVAYLRILVNKTDNISLLRIINFPARGLGKVAIGRLINNATAQNKPILEYILTNDLKDFKGKQRINLLDFAKKIKALAIKAETESVEDVVISLVDDFGLLDIYENSNDPQDLARAENIKEFVNSAGEFKEHFIEERESEAKLEEYLQELSLLTDLDNVSDAEETVKLMTMHNAKGLEFDHVFVVGLEDGLLPHSRSIQEEKAMEEERRLFYVAVTRAKKSVHLCHVRYRRVYSIQMPGIPSRFLSDIDGDLIDFEDCSSVGIVRETRKKRVPRKNLVLENDKFFQIGQKIAHKKFGQGTILSVEGKGSNAKLTISFSSGELKKIMGSFVNKI